MNIWKLAGFGVTGYIGYKCFNEINGEFSKMRKKRRKKKKKR